MTAGGRELRGSCAGSTLFLHSPPCGAVSAFRVAEVRNIRARQEPVLGSRETHIRGASVGNLCGVILTISERHKPDPRSARRRVRFRSNLHQSR